MSSTHELPSGQEGEICLRGPNIFKGYYQNADATSSSFINGWFRSGDIGYIDSEGNLFLTDRYKELIKYNGFQVAPAQLEGLLLGHEAVDDVAVIGVWSRERERRSCRGHMLLLRRGIGRVGSWRGRFVDGWRRRSLPTRGCVGVLDSLTKFRRVLRGRF
jgi:4-coumarate--CoA ligase